MKKELQITRCLDEIMSGKKTLEECVARYPRLAEELTELIEVALKVAGEAATTREEFKKSAAAALAREMAGTSPHAGSRKNHLWFKNIFSPRSLAFKFFVAIAVLVLAGGGTVFASGSSLPGDAIYPVKRSVENIRLALAFSPESRADKYLERVHERVEETVGLTAQQGSLSIIVLTEVPEDIDNAIRQIADAKDGRDLLLQRLIDITGSSQATLTELLATTTDGSVTALEHSMDVLRRGNLIAEIGYGNPGFLVSGPSVNDEDLEEMVFKIEGDLIYIEGKNWNVGGVRLDNVSETHGGWEVGKALEIEGIFNLGTAYLWDINSIQMTDNRTIIEGTVSDKSTDNSTVYIGELEFTDIDYLKHVPVGTRLHIEGDEREGHFYPDEDERNFSSSGPDEHESDD